MKKLFLAGCLATLVAGQVSAAAVTAENTVGDTSITVTGDGSKFVKGTFTYALSSNVFAEYTHDINSIGVLAASQKGSGAVFGGAPSAPVARCTEDTRKCVPTDPLNTTTPTCGTTGASTTVVANDTGIAAKALVVDTAVAISDFPVAPNAASGC